jgi:molybdopterin molybdotransferase
MQEDIVIDGDQLFVPKGVKRGANCRLAGEDMRHGQVVLKPGLRLKPQEVGVAATVGRKALKVHRPLRVALVSSGDELREPGEPLPHGMTYDSNRTILKGLLHGLGVSVADQGIWPDRAEIVQARMAALAADHHAIITSGGASRGDEDHMVDAVRRLGRLHFWQIAVKPGRPLAFGQLQGAPGDTVFIGLPGNPVAAVICFLLFARPMLTALAGGTWPEPRAFLVPADFAMTKKPGRREYLRARLLRSDAGVQVARRIEREGSGILTSLTDADGLIDVAEETVAVKPGDPVPFIPFSEFGI